MVNFHMPDDRPRERRKFYGPPLAIGAPDTESRPTTPTLPPRAFFQDFKTICTITVGSGPSKKSYSVHRELLTTSSPFFAAALAPARFREGELGVLNLPEENPTIFSWFLHWLYTRSLKTAAAWCSPRISNSGVAAAAAARFHKHYVLDGPNEGAKERRYKSVPSCTYDGYIYDDLCDRRGRPRYFVLFELFALADRLLLPDLSNEVLNTIARLSDNTDSVPTPSDTWLLYGGKAENGLGDADAWPSGFTTPRGTCGGQRNSPLKLLVLDLFAYKKTETVLAQQLDWRDEWFGSKTIEKLQKLQSDPWHPHFLRDLCAKLKQSGPESLSRHTGYENWLRNFDNIDYPVFCEICHKHITAGPQSARCYACNKAFHKNCFNTVDPTTMWVDFTGCQPWEGKGLCRRYHAHDEGGEGKSGDDESGEEIVQP